MKGRPLAKTGYEQELVSVRGFIAMQNKADGSVPAAVEKVHTYIHPHTCVVVLA